MAVAAVASAGRTVRDQVSDAEWQTRVDLAMFYRLVARHGWDDLVGTHISTKVPGEEGAFLLNPYGLMFDEITASSLVKLDMDGNVLLDSGWPVNAAGFTIHSACQGARADSFCVAHTHTVGGMAVSALSEGLLPLHQKAMRFYKRTSYHAYEGIADDLQEREHLIRDLGTNDTMILENHGLLVCGPTVRATWAMLYNLEKCCSIQLAAQASGDELIMPSENLAESTYQQFSGFLNKPGAGDKLDGWDSFTRMLTKEDPSFMH